MKLLVTSRTRPETLAKAASRGTPLPLRLARTLSSSDLLRMFREHATAEYGEELTELMLASEAANSALVAVALKQYPTSLGVKLGAAPSNGASRAQLPKLSRSMHWTISALDDNQLTQQAIDTARVLYPRDDRLGHR